MKEQITTYTPMIWLKFKLITYMWFEIWHFIHLKLALLEFCKLLMTFPLGNNF